MRFKLCADKSTRDFGIFARSVRVKLLKFCSTAVYGRSAPDASSAYADVPSPSIRSVFLDAKGGI